MQYTNIAFKTLRAEMARNNVTIESMASEIGMRRETLGRKLSMKSDLKLDEAFLINKKFFPYLSIMELFEELTVDNSASQAS